MYMAGRYEEALARYQEARRLAPDDLSIHYNIGILIQDYLFDTSDAEKGIQQLEKARQHLEQFARAGRMKTKVNDAKRRIKNIREMVPMLREQQRMMREMQQTPQNE